MTATRRRDTNMVICINIWAKEPIFHEWGGFDLEEHAAYTHCGIRLSTGMQWRTIRMPRDRAQRIGRACRKCEAAGMTWIPRVTTTHANWSSR